MSELTPDGLVHRVCQWLCDEKVIGKVAMPGCQRCSIEIDTPYGKAMPACVLRAQELIAIVRGEQ